MSTSRKRKISDIIKSAEATLQRYNEVNDAISQVLSKCMSKSNGISASLENDCLNEIPKIVNKNLREFACIDDNDESNGVIEEGPSTMLTSLEIQTLLKGILPFLDVYSKANDATEKYKRYSFQWALIRLMDILDVVSLQINCTKDDSTLLDIEAVLAASGDESCCQLDDDVQQELNICIDHTLHRLNTYLCTRDVKIDNDWAQSFEILKRRLQVVRNSSQFFQEDIDDKIQVFRRFNWGPISEEGQINTDKSKESGSQSQASDISPFVRQLNDFLAQNTINSDKS